MKYGGVVASVLGLVVLGTALAGCQLTRAGYETAPFRVMEKDGAVEVREYPVLQVAETPASGDDFMRLFRYISEDNAAQQKIAMTTPVFMNGVGSTNEQMAFVLPETLSKPPVPGNPAVTLREIPPRTVAVRRFRGGQQGPNGPAVFELRAWMAARGLPAEGEPVFAYFDPPWIPGPFRRNEVMIPTRWPASVGREEGQGLPGRP